MTKETNWYHYDNRGKNNNDYPYNQYDDELITINAQDIINGKKEELKKIIPSNNYDPNKAYKKAVNFLKRKTK